MKYWGREGTLSVAIESMRYQVIPYVYNTGIVDSLDGCRDADSPPRTKGGDVRMFGVGWLVLVGFFVCLVFLVFLWCVFLLLLFCCFVVLLCFVWCVVWGVLLFLCFCVV